MMSTCKKIKLDPHLSPCTKTDSRWIKDLSAKPETTKWLEENPGSVPHGTGVNFGQALRPTGDKRDLINLKSFRTANETTK